MRCIVVLFIVYYSSVNPHQLPGWSGCLPRPDGLTVCLYSFPGHGGHVPHLHQAAFHGGRHPAGSQ